MPTTHQLAAEQLSVYQVMRAGYPNPSPPRTSALVNAAISTLGSTPTRMVLTFDGDGVYNFTANVTTPTTMVTEIPAGVTVNLAAGVTFTLNGPLISHNPNWQTGAGTVVFGTGAPVIMSSIRSQHAEFPVAADTIGVQVYTPSAIPNPGIILQNSTSGGNLVPAITLYRNPADPTQNWTLSNNLTNMFHVSHPGGQAYFAVTNAGSWFGNGTATPTPTHELQLQHADAAYPGGGPFLSASDSRLKTVLRLFPDGLLKLQALPDPIIYTYNGKGDMQADGTEYIGMIADDVQPVTPYMVSTYQAKLEPTDPEPTDLLSLNNGSLVYILMNAVRELATRVEALEGLTGGRFVAVEDIAHTHTGTGSAAGEVPHVPSTRGARAHAPRQGGRRAPEDEPAAPIEHERPDTDSDADDQEEAHPRRRRHR